MATFRFGHTIDIHWNGYDIVGDAGTVFSIPDQLYEEFEGDIRPVEPTLEWLDTNEFQTLKDSVTSYTVIATTPISVASTSSTKTWSLIDGGVTSGKIADLAVTASKISSGSATNGYVLTANGSGAAQWAAQTGSGGGVSAITGVSPISATVVGANATVSIDQTLITAAAATNAEVLRVYVKNTTGSTIPKGSAVYITGATGDNALISLASASAEASSSKTLGITASAIATDDFGYVIENGLLQGIDTSTASAGQSVWLGNTPGSFVYGAPPAEPSHSVYLGVVIRVQQNNGEILVKVQNGYEIDELHDVSAASPSDGDIIQYKSSSSLWTKSSIAGAGIAASTHTHAYQPAGTYVTAVNGTAPIAASTTTAGVVSVSLTASYSTSTHDHSGTYQPVGNYQTAGTYVTSVAGDAAVAASGTTAISLSHTTTDGYHHVPATSTTNSGKFLKAGATAGSEAWANIAMSDITTGNYIATATGSTGVTVTGSGSNAGAAVFSIGQAVATTSNVTFNNVTVNGNNSNWAVRASVTSAVQSVANATSVKIALDLASTSATNATYDPNSWFSNANDRITVTVAGFYLVTGTISWASNTTGRRITRISVNGTDVASIAMSASNTGNTAASASTVLWLAVNDYVELFGEQSSGGALNTAVASGYYPALAVARVGA